MKVVYLDTNVLMAMLCPEPETDQVLGWFARSDGIELVSCPWSRTELASALAIKQRTKQLSKKEVELAGQKGLSILASTRCELVETIDFDEAAVLCAQSGTNLRAPDALHLSLARRTGCTALASMDVVMQKAAKKLGLRTVNFSGKV
ncbi:MAG: type II toxin-antitoxin system VapC family toxin [Polaromonas sp.]|uniref:type II toxin-antitoxin system VapC family toxin n=1 Tax=Polaromonas sp. TaxID=1869339 RepID=UPI0027371127|nr:type II toxin-antitoxin system VapC family toxin [Polaromonas sp.]MDP2819025.1 type II toxin-antitoxin system VapC family toxin [Polaromonas sp.]